MSQKLKQVTVDSLELSFDYLPGAGRAPVQAQAIVGLINEVLRREFQSQPQLVLRSRKGWRDHTKVEALEA